jgi:hypothetical protein
METYNRNGGNVDPVTAPRPRDPNRIGQLLAGLFVVGIGVLLLARQAGMEFPRWIFSFESILIALGLYLGIRHSFRGVAWVIPVLIGGFLLLDDFYPEFDIEDFTWPLIIIGIGLFIMFRATKKKGDWKKWEADAARHEDTSDEVLDSTVIFGGAKKNIISKNFRGGEAVTVFGGTEINLMQADLTGPVVLELTQVFGGTKLIVPPHWKVWSKDMVTILGGIDDKRPMMGNPAEDTNKTLILKGTCMLGGIEIRSY